MTNPYRPTLRTPEDHHPERAPLVGRETETRRILASLAAARAGHGGALFVTGEPGIGKTRLAAEALTAAARAGMVTARGRSATVGAAVPCRPLVEALLSLARSGLLPDRDELGRYGPLLVRLLTGSRAAEADAESPLMVAETVLRLAGVVGRRRGFLLVLEDLHAADAGTLAIVEYLLDNIGQLPALLLLTAGDTPRAAAELAVRARQRGAAEILAPRPLGRDDLRLLLAAGQGTTPAEVDPELLERAMAASAGIPFVAEEFVRGLARPAPAAAPFLPAPGAAPLVPAAIADRVGRTAEQLGPRATAFLGMAALFGPSFPLPVLQRAAGCEDGEVSAVLRAATAAHLITPDAANPQWYAFRYGWAGQALLDALAPGERADCARRAVRALTALHPGLPGAWCVHAARLQGYAGDTREAVRLYSEAAGRAMAEGALERALALLLRAHGLADPEADPGPYATLLEHLLDALTLSAGADGLPDWDHALDALADRGVPAPRRAALHARLAELATVTGLPGQALPHLDLARRLLGDHPADADAAVVDAAAALVEPGRLAPERLRTAAESARRAVDAAQRAGLPAVACKALLELGRLALEQDEPAALNHFMRARALAHTRRLPALRVSAEVELATIAARRDGGPAPVEEARREALRMGALPLAHEAGFALALDQVQRCAFPAAADRIREASADAARLGLGRALARLTLADAVCHAHQGLRAGMQDALERLTPLVDAAPGLRAMSYGLARAFCSLLEERHDAAEQEFAQALAYDAENPATGDFGRHGVTVLLGVLAGRTGRPHHADAVRASAAGTRWNRQFTGLAHAVLLGREGCPGEAADAAGAALEAAEPYPMARHLGLRLIARSAHDDGWGTPVDWLREAEEYFHGAALPAPAGACRALLRGMGAPVRQRRTGTQQVPPDLRRRGITVREFEVARLLAERIGNKDIAGRLHISPRTVEKHVASLLQKTGHPNRASFASAARDLAAVSHAR